MNVEELLTVLIHSHHFRMPNAKLLTDLSGGSGTLRGGGSGAHRGDLNCIPGKMEEENILINSLFNMWDQTNNVQAKHALNCVDL